MSNNFLVGDADFCSSHPSVSQHCSIADVIPGDRAALVDLYNAAGGGGWTNAAGWNTTVGVCTWFRVTCSFDGSRVTQLCVAGRSTIYAAL